MNNPAKKKLSLRGLNNALTVIVVLFAVYIMVIPFWPSIKYRLITSRRPAPVYGTLGQTRADPASPTPTPLPIPQDNRIVIPSSHIDQPIIEGYGLWVIEDGGSWRKNLWVESPKDIGNTVIIGHRFTYKNPEGAFYNLDKVAVGDDIAIYWQGEELLYTVAEIKIVAPEAVEVEAATSDRRLTLYTCTPLVTAENRLVVVAFPKGAAR